MAQQSTAPMASGSARSSAFCWKTRWPRGLCGPQFGGFLGIGDDYYPLPWEKLRYDEQLDGYRIDLTKEQITSAPRYDDLDDDSWYKAEDRRVYDYYGVPPYWM